MISTESPNSSALRLDPELVDAIDRQLALAAAAGVDEVLEAVHRHLPEHRRDRAVDPVGEQAQALRPRRWPLEQPPEHERLAEHRRGLGERQRRRLVEDALRLGERGMEAVAELVRHRQHVPPARGEVEHHVGMDARHGVGAERAAALVRADRRVDPVLVEEAARDAAGLGREARRRCRARGRAPRRTRT